MHGYAHDHGGHREDRRNRTAHVNIEDKDGKSKLRSVIGALHWIRSSMNVISNTISRGHSGHSLIFGGAHDSVKK